MRFIYVFVPVNFQYFYWKAVLYAIKNFYFRIIAIINFKPVQLPCHSVFYSPKLLPNWRSYYSPVRFRTTPYDFIMDNDMLIRVRRNIHTRCTPHHTQGMLACWTCCAGHQQSSNNAYIMHSDICTYTMPHAYIFVTCIIYNVTCTCCHASMLNTIVFWNASQRSELWVC